MSNHSIVHSNNLKFHKIMILVIQSTIRHFVFFSLTLSSRKKMTYCLISTYSLIQSHEKDIIYLKIIEIRSILTMTLNLVQACLVSVNSWRQDHQCVYPMDFYRVTDPLDDPLDRS